MIIKTTEEIRADIWYTHRCNYMYWNYDTKEMHEMKTYGGYYPPIASNPSLYIRKRDDVKEILLRLRAKGKKLFLATNSHYDYCDLTMSSAFGPDWRTLFDLCITGAAKPTFFQTTANRFLKADTKKPLFRGEEAKVPLKPGDEYVMGNYKDIETTFESMLGRGSLKYLYVGDNYVSDCYWSGKLKNWDSLAVVEEFASKLWCEIWE